MTTCKQPDRHAPKLVCGYPLPCPHHTVVIEEANADVAIHAVRWLAGLPNIAIGAYAVPGDPSKLGVRAIAFYRSVEFWRAERILPLTAGAQEIRDAFDANPGGNHGPREGRVIWVMRYPVSQGHVPG